MRKIIIIGLLCLVLFVSSVSGQSVVMLEENQGGFDLVFLSSDQVEVSGFQALLHCGYDVQIISVDGVTPFEVFSGIPDETGYMTIVGFTTVLPPKSEKTVLAKILTSGSGSIQVVGVDMDDFSRQPILLENQQLNIAATPTSTQISTPYPTASSATPVAESTVNPTLQQTQNTAPSSTTVPESTQVQVPLSTNQPTTSSKTPLSIVPVIIGLMGVVFMLRRTYD